MAALIEYVQDGWDAAAQPGSIVIAAGRSVARWVSPVVDISVLGRAQDSLVQWDATVPGGANVTVDIRLSFDGGATWGAWQSAANGGPIPGLAVGADISRGWLQYRVTLYPNPSGQSPAVHHIVILLGFLGSVQRYFPLRPRLVGTYIQHRITDESPEIVTILAVGERWRPLRKLRPGELEGSVAT